MKIIDAHIHPFSCGEENLCAFDTELKFTKTNVFYDRLKELGVNKAVGSVLKKDEYTLDFSQIKKLNLSAYSLQEKSSGFYLCGIHIHPDFIKESMCEIEAYDKKGIKIIGELCGYMMGFGSLVSDGMYKLLRFAEELDFTVCFHTTSAEEIKSLAKEFKKLRMVFAHPAYGEEFLKRVNVIKKQDNLFMDLSGTGIAAYGMIERAVSLAGSEKLLFGTDYPIYNPASYIACVNSAKISLKDKENIFYKNAEYIYKIK